ncbi:MAG: hypothetical protein JST40_07175 [Armatimonadetes bacterium]|nr:hypothetical protein [Armatimonadota bacterium]
MITALIVTAIVGGAQIPTTVCPLQGEPASDKIATIDYNSVRYSFCCQGCVGAFAKDPAKSIKTAETKFKGKALGTYLFDPVSRLRVEPKDAKASMVYNGVVYPFQSTANFATFKKNPKTYTVAPTKEALKCPVAIETLHGPSGAYAYRDIKGVRYFICCGGCLPKFDKEPAKFTGNVTADIKAPTAWMLKPGEVAPSECKDGDK